MSVGRPLRFLALALGGWVMIRVALLLPEVASLPASEVLPRVIEALVPQVAAVVMGHPRPKPRMATVAPVTVAPSIFAALRPWQPPPVRPPPFGSAR